MDEIHEQAIPFLIYDQQSKSKIHYLKKSKNIINNILLNWQLSEII